MIYLWATLIPLLVSIGIQYLILKKKQLVVTTLVKIVVGFYLVTPLLNIAVVAYDYNWPEPIEDYRVGPLVSNVIILFVFITPIILRSAKFLIFSFSYILVNQVLFFFLGFGVISGEKLLITVLKFGIVLFVFIRALESLPGDKHLVERF